METIRQFAEEQLVARGDAGCAGCALIRNGKPTRSWWDAHDNANRMSGSTQLANLRAVLRAADHGDLGAAAIALRVLPPRAALESTNPSSAGNS